MGYWKSKVLPKIKKVFDKSGTKKAAAAEASKSFDDSKEEYNKAFEEKKTELQTKVVEIYEASSTEIKGLVKERNESGLKKHSTAVNKFLEELVKIDFPGSKPVSEASSKFGPWLVSGPVFFVFEKVSSFIVTEEKVEEAAPAAAETKTEQETSAVKEREIVVEEEEEEEKKEEKQDEKKPQPEEASEEKTESSDPPPPPPAAEEEKIEEHKTETTEAKEEQKPAEPVAEPPKP